jgi:hypothetical protein
MVSRPLNTTRRVSPLASGTHVSMVYISLPAPSPMPRMAVAAAHVQVQHAIGGGRIPDAASPLGLPAR